MCDTALAHMFFGGFDYENMMPMFDEGEFAVHCNAFSPAPGGQSRCQTVISC